MSRLSDRSAVEDLLSRRSIRQPLFPVKLANSSLVRPTCGAKTCAPERQVDRSKREQEGLFHTKKQTWSVSCHLQTSRREVGDEWFSAIAPRTRSEVVVTQPDSLSTLWEIA